MSFNASVDIAIYFHSLQINIIQHQGWLQFQFHIYYFDENDQPIYSIPFDIIKKHTKQKYFESQIDQDHRVYLSEIIPIKFNKQQYILQQICIFRSYVNVSKMDLVKFKCTIDLLLCQELQISEKSEFKKVGSFECRINQISRISEYLPVSFDEFEGTILRSTYNSIILQFKYHKQQEDEQDFLYYVQKLTSGFKRKQIQEFTNEYLDRLEKEFRFLEYKYMEALSLVSESSYKEQEIIKSTKLKLLLDSIPMGQNFAKQQKLLIIQEIMKDITKLKSICYDLWSKFIRFILKISIRIIQFHQKNYKNNQKAYLRQNVQTHKKNRQNRLQVKKSSQQQQLYHQIKKTKPTFLIQDQNIFNTEKIFPHLTEQVFENLKKGQKSPTNQPPNFTHVFILVHGFQAERTDFYIFKNLIQSKIKNSLIFISSVNEGRTDQNIEILAKGLYQEVIQFLNHIKTKNYKLSFIGHSLGGIIIRTALEYMEQYSDKFFLYISLSTPHLGYLYIESKLVELGIWYLNKCEKCQSIKQLTMTDKQEYEQSFLYKLTENNNNFGKFQKIVLVSSSQDLYVPFQSARIERNAKFQSNVMDDMIWNLNKYLEQAQLYRINVTFEISENNIDTFLGRTAHMKLLTDIDFLKIFVYTFDYLFL